MAGSMMRAFRLENGATGFADIEFVLDQMRRTVEKQSNVLFRGLVERQAERITDEIALGRYTNKPDGVSILDVARDVTLDRIKIADDNRQPIEFNLGISVQVMMGETEKKENRILFVIYAPGSAETYCRGFRKITGIVPYDLSDLSDGKPDPHAQFWEGVTARYGTDMPLGCSLFDYGALKLEPEKMKFRSPEQRASQLALEEVSNIALSMYSGGREIAPHKLMEYVTLSLERVTHPDFRKLMERKRVELTAILPKITAGLVQDKNAGKIPKDMRPPADALLDNAAENSQVKPEDT